MDAFILLILFVLLIVFFITKLKEKNDEQEQLLDKEKNMVESGINKHVILTMFKKKWYAFLLLLPSVFYGFLSSLILAFMMASRYHSEFVGIITMLIVFFVFAPMPLLIFWIEIYRKAINKKKAVAGCLLIHCLISALFWVGSALLFNM